MHLKHSSLINQILNSCNLMIQDNMHCFPIDSQQQMWWLIAGWSQESCQLIEFIGGNCICCNCLMACSDCLNTRRCCRCPLHLSMPLVLCHFGLYFIVLYFLVLFFTIVTGTIRLWWKCVVRGCKICLYLLYMCERLCKLHCVWWYWNNLYRVCDVSVWTFLYRNRDIRDAQRIASRSVI